MKIYSQNDPEWKSKILGFGKANKTTIGTDGCTITCVGMLADIDPNATNNRLIAVKGYAASSPDVYNLILWAKIKDAIPTLEFEWRGYTFDAHRVEDAVSRNGGCLVEVDATPIKGFKHWVLYRPNNKIYDPFDGKEKDRSAYKPIGYSIINITLTPPPSPSKKMVALPQEEVDQLRTDRDGNFNLFRDLRKMVTGALDLPEESTGETIVKSINAYRGNANNFEKLDVQIKSMKTAYEEQVSTLQQQLTAKQDTITTLCTPDNTDVQPYIEQLNTKDQQITDMSEEIKKLKIQQPNISLWEFIKKILHIQ